MPTTGLSQSDMWSRSLDAVLGPHLGYYYVCILCKVSNTYLGRYFASLHHYNSYHGALVAIGSCGMVFLIKNS